MASHEYIELRHAIDTLRRRLDGLGGGGSGISQLTGDVTAGPGSGSQAATIPASSIDYAQIQNVSATSRALGRKTAGAGVIEELTASELLDFISSTRGVILYRGASGWAALSPSTDGYVLTTQGAGADPIWEPSTGGSPGAGGDVTFIEEQTPSGTGTITFSSLGSYTHLEILYSARSDKAAVNSEQMFLRFNGDTGANYDMAVLYNGAATTPAASETLAGTSGDISTLPAATATAGRGSGGTISIYDYRGTTFNKVALSISHGSVATVTLGTILRLWGVEWRSTSAITSVTLFLAAGNFVSGSKFTLYGYS